MTDTIIRPDFGASAEPKYIVLIQSMRTAIRSGKLASGSRLPPVRKMAYQLGITPGTVARAYKLATEERLVETTVGRGTYVTGGLVTRAAPDEPLVNAPREGQLDFRAARVPEAGQSAMIRAILGQMSRVETTPYIDYPTHLSDLPARRAVLDWIGPDRVGDLEADDIVLGLGAQNAVMVALQTILHGPSPVILTETLCYPGVRHAARLLRAQVIGVEIDGEGIIPKALEEALQRHGGQVLLTSAHSQSPTTARMGVARKEEIAEIARRYQIQIIEDDCHCINRPETPTFRSLCPERGWYISSLTKTVSAALRFGYIACPREQAAAARQVAQSSFYGLPQPVLDLCTHMIVSGKAEAIRAEVEEFIAKRVALVVAILSDWDVTSRSDIPFVWLKLPQGWRGSTFARACEAEGIRIKPADEFALPDGHAPHAVRLTVSAIADDDVFEAALQQIGALLSNPPLNVDF